MAKIGDDFIVPNGEEVANLGIGVHLYSGGLRKFDVDLSIELQRAPEDSGTPGTPLVASAFIIARFPGAPHAFMDLNALVPKREADDNTLFFYRARMTGIGLTASAWSAWDSGNPAEFFSTFELPPVPPYPTVMIVQEQPAERAANTSVTIRAFPDHADNVIRFVYLAIGAAIPTPSRDASVWTTYTGEFELLRDPTLQKKLVSFAELNGIFGPVNVAEVTPNADAIIDSNLFTETGTTPIIKVKDALEVNAATVKVAVYRRLSTTGSVLWPTRDGLQAGQLDGTYFRGFIDEDDDFSYEDGGFNGRYDSAASADIIADIMVPINASERAGPRLEDSYTVVNVPVPQFKDGTQKRTSIDLGVSCGNPRTIKVEWDTNDATDGVEEVRVSWQRDGGGYSAATGSPITSPVSTKLLQFDIDFFEDAVQPLATIDVKIELVTTSGSILRDVVIFIENKTFHAIQLAC